MNKRLNAVLKKIDDRYRGAILNGSRFYVELNIGKLAEELGYSDIKTTYQHASAIVPLKHPANGMKVRIDGRTFVNYAQFESGVVVPKHVAEEAALPHEPFVPNDSMILNFA